MDDFTNDSESMEHISSVLIPFPLFEHLMHSKKKKDNGQNVQSMTITMMSVLLTWKRPRKRRGFVSARMVLSVVVAHLCVRHRRLPCCEVDSTCTGRPPHDAAQQQPPTEPIVFVLSHLEGPQGRGGGVLFSTRQP